MLSRDNAADTVIVGKTKQKGTFTRLPLRIAVKDALEDAESQSRTLFELGNLAEIYFAERVVLCEGKTDRRILPCVRALARRSSRRRACDLRFAWIMLGRSEGSASLAGDGHQGMCSC